MFANHLKAVWADGQQAVGGWATLGSPFATEILSVAGFDYVCVDLQHGLAHQDSMAPMLIATARSGVTPLVRVPSNEVSAIGKALDVGAHGVIVPMVNSADEARAAVAACRYAPAGVRSFGPVRAGLVTGGMSLADVDAQVLCLPMIETAAALERVDEICAVPGVDGLYIGPSDLSVSVGLPPYTDPVAEELLTAIASIRAAAAAHGLPVGIHTTSGRQARAYLDAGLDMVTVSTDAAILRTAVSAELSAARGAGDVASTGGY
jgi:4-hydroxy-2-oxoheptanedioate aldolase